MQFSLFQYIEVEDLHAEQVPAADKLDDCTIFGQMVATKIKNLNQKNQRIAMKRIDNCIFELEMAENLILIQL